MTPTRCHYLKHGKDWIFIPGCMGAAASGPHACTCLTTDERVKILENQVEVLIRETSMVVKDLDYLIARIAPGESVVTIEEKAREANQKVAIGHIGPRLVKE